jgi:hypothetical protein
MAPFLLMHAPSSVIFTLVATPVVLESSLLLIPSGSRGIHTVGQDVLARSCIVRAVHESLVPIVGFGSSDCLEDYSRLSPVIGRYCIKAL